MLMAILTSPEVDVMTAADPAYSGGADCTTSAAPMPRRVRSRCPGPAASRYAPVPVPINASTVRSPVHRHTPRRYPRCRGRGRAWCGPSGPWYHDRAFDCVNQPSGLLSNAG